MNVSSGVNTSLSVLAPVFPSALAPGLSVPSGAAASVPFSAARAAAPAPAQSGARAASAAESIDSAPVPAAAEFAAPATKVVPPATIETAVPSFITTASLISVSGGTTAVTLMWTVAKILFGKSAEMPVIPFCCALVVGAVIYWLSVEDKKVRLSTKEKVVGGFVAFLNSMVLFSASLGIHGR